VKGSGSESEKDADDLNDPTYEEEQQAANRSEDDDNDKKDVEQESAFAVKKAKMRKPGRLVCKREAQV